MLYLYQLACINKCSDFSQGVAIADECFLPKVHECFTNVNMTVLSENQARSKIDVTIIKSYILENDREKLVKNSC